MDDKLVQYRGGAELPSLEAKPHVFFKWRCFDASLPGSELIAEVFTKNEVQPMVMLRRSILEQALKIFLSEKIYGGRHQQFIAAKMSKEQYGEYLQQQQEISVTVEPEDITAIAAILDNFSHRTKVLIQ